MLSIPLLVYIIKDTNAVFLSSLIFVFLAVPSHEFQYKLDKVIYL